MSTENRNSASGLRVFYQDELDEGIRQMKLDGATLEDCVAELHILADWLHKQAEGLPAAWETLIDPRPVREQLKALEMFGTIDYDDDPASA